MAQSHPRGIESYCCRRTSHNCSCILRSGRSEGTRFRGQQNSWWTGRGSDDHLKDVGDSGMTKDVLDMMRDGRRMGRSRIVDGGIENGEHVSTEWRKGIFYSRLTLAVSRLSYEEAMGAFAVYFIPPFQSSVLFNARHFFSRTMDFTDVSISWNRRTLPERSQEFASHQDCRRMLTRKGSHDLTIAANTGVRTSTGQK